MPVLINGRTAVHAGSEGTLTTQDTCYTGPFNQPITYQNIAKSADAENTAKTVFINGHPVCHKESYFAKSYGSEAGNSGVNSGTIGGKAEFTTASSNVFIEGIPAVRQGDLMVSNNRNTPPAPLMQKGVPYGGDKDKINKFPKMPYPKLEFDLSELPLHQLPPRIIIIPGGQTFMAYGSVGLTGYLTLQQEGQTNPLTFSLDNYKIESKQRLGDFVDTFKLIKLDKEGVCVGSSIAGEYWTSEITVKPMGITATCYPQPLNRNYHHWIIEGNLGYFLDINYEPYPPNINFAPVRELISEHAKLLVGTGIFLVMLDELAKIFVVVVS